MIHARAAAAGATWQSAGIEQRRRHLRGAIASLIDSYRVRSPSALPSQPLRTKRVPFGQTAEAYVPLPTPDEADKPWFGPASPTSVDLTRRASLRNETRLYLTD